NAAGNISYRDATGIAIASVQTAGNASFVTGDTVTQSGAITANKLSVKTMVNSGAPIVLNNPVNDVAAIDLRSRNATDTANAPGTISYTDANGFDIAALQTSGNANLIANGPITESGSIVANGVGRTVSVTAGAG